ncbi:hypothetical protein [Mycetocola reblochoni]|uniref:hypothetical protein n=1 Tax=Mycetocola reblochoni TaxID=331618 RepID=UPI003F99C9B3
MSEVAASHAHDGSSSKFINTKHQMKGKFMSTTNHNDTRDGLGVTPDSAVNALPIDARLLKARPSWATDGDASTTLDGSPEVTWTKGAQLGADRVVEVSQLDQIINGQPTTGTPVATVFTMTTVVSVETAHDALALADALITAAGMLNRINTQAVAA